MDDKTPVPGRRESRASFIRRFEASRAMREQYPNDTDRILAADAEWSRVRCGANGAEAVMDGGKE